MTFAALSVSYPFAVGESNGIDTLYTTLAIGRGTVVSGRYLFALTFDIGAGILAYVSSFAASALTKVAFEPTEALVTILALFVVFSVIQAVQLPIYFKLGYAKAKFLAYVPFVGFALLSVLLGNLLGADPASSQAGLFVWLAANPVLAAALGVAVWLGMMLLSYRLSLAVYKKRDF